MRSQERWAWAAFGWMVTSFGWHLWMGVEYRRAMAAGSDEAPVWLFLAYDGLITAMSAAGAVIILATVRPWGGRFPVWMIRVPLWFGAVLLVVRGVPGLVENVTTATGLTPRGLLGRAAELADTGSGAFWTGMTINGYFFVGAVVLVPVAVAFERVVAAGRAGGGRVSGSRPRGPGPTARTYGPGDR
ncbi:DUF3995 domain-containing protein [Streptomyces sp. NPDC059788]|uniref:DUF3995 domain-containing protein n=1 Tax=Streptomyces sp. NPDC059788 TaxID=3346948 RepID=UPI003654583F